MTNLQQSGMFRWKRQNRKMFCQGSSKLGFPYSIQCTALADPGFLINRKSMFIVHVFGLFGKGSGICVTFCNSDLIPQNWRSAFSADVSLSSLFDHSCLFTSILVFFHEKCLLSKQFFGPDCPKWPFLLKYSPEPHWRAHTRSLLLIFWSCSHIQLPPCRKGDGLVMMSVMTTKTTKTLITMLAMMARPWWPWKQ